MRSDSFGRGFDSLNDRSVVVSIDGVWAVFDHVHVLKVQ